MNPHEEIAATGWELYFLVNELAHWSQETFGRDTERGPIGPLKHLEKEAREAQEQPSDPLEYADCFILIVDAARRAGIGFTALVQYALDKLEINMEREWPEPVADETAEHIR